MEPILWIAAVPFVLYGNEQHERLLFISASLNVCKCSFWVVPHRFSVSFAYTYQSSGSPQFQLQPSPARFVFCFVLLNIDASLLISGSSLWFQWKFAVAAMAAFTLPSWRSRVVCLVQSGEGRHHGTWLCSLSGFFLALHDPYASWATSLNRYLCLHPLATVTSPLKFFRIPDFEVLCQYLREWVTEARFSLRSPLHRGHKDILSRVPFAEEKFTISDTHAWPGI